MLNTFTQLANLEYYLWSFDPQAKTSGKFSEEELQSLQREFQHHKDKINEYNIVMDTVSRTEGKKLMLWFKIFNGYLFQSLISNELIDDILIFSKDSHNLR